jgi:hypothetical protein
LAELNRLHTVGEAQRAELDECREVIEAQRAELDECREVIEAQRAELDECREVIEAQRTELQMIHKSRSWKITAPLRQLFRVLQAGKSTPTESQD